MQTRLAVIGCGYITLASHGPAYARLAAEDPGLVLAACCDIDPRLAEAVREKLGFQRAYIDFSTMLETERPDAVCLNVPVGLTARMGVQILQAGVPLLCEKPPALTVEELDPLIYLAAEKGSLHQVAFNRRFAPLVQELKRRLLGETVLHVDHTFTRVGRTDADFSTTAIHGIDTLRYLLGADFETLQFQYQDLKIGSDKVTVFVADGRFESGTGVHMLFQPVSGISSERTVVYTPDCTFELRLNHASDAPGWLRHWHNGQLEQDLDAAQVCGSREDFVLSGFYAEDAAFLSAVKAGRTLPEHSFSAARQSVELMQALRERRAGFKQSAASPLG
jgi:myo-inositol 2-dehydrogenase / D-chiro-inositol 1-dehydrogenase